MGRNKGRVRHRFIQVPNEFWQELKNVGTNHNLVMLSLEGICNKLGIGELIINLISFSKTNGKGLNGPIHQLRHQTDNGARIQATTEKSSQWHVADEVRANGFSEFFAK